VTDRTARDPRLLGLGAAAIIAGYAVVVAAISAAATSGDLGPPEVAPTPVRLAAMFLLPAVIGAIGAIRRSRPLLIAAGVLCLAQSFVAFSGVTIPFIVPAILLLAIGAGGGGRSENPVRQRVGGVAVVILGLAMWVAPYALAETTCWVARPGPDGSVVYTSIPVTDTVTLAPTDLGSGCDGGTITLQGAALGAVFGIGAVAIALLASTTTRASNEGSLRS
jgi:hypothetical protein